MSFLNAEWRKLVLVNYAIDPVRLKTLVPYGTELDLWNDTCYLSLVGFRFVNTKLLGVAVPFHTDFEEVNLRFYVRRKVAGEWRRGVVFIKEIVPKLALTLVANTIYKENYQTLPMGYTWDIEGEQQRIAYRWKVDKKIQSFAVTAKKEAQVIPEGSETEFITEHYWGYAHVNDKKTNEYQVTHPRWEAYPILETTIRVDFGLTYGSRFGFLNEDRPTSVVLAEGSKITVESKQVIKG